MTLFGVDEVLLADREELTAPALRMRVSEAVDSVSAIVGEDRDALLKRILKFTNLPRLADADDHDLHELMWELQACEREGRRGYRARLRRITSVPRPGDIGRLPRPRWAKAATAAGLCQLCGDAYARNAMIGRAKWGSELASLYVPMGWLCWHCTVNRRDRPRRRDVLLRLFHGLFAGDGIGINGHESRVLLEWLTEKPALATSKPWTSDPLDETLARLRTGASERKPIVWLAETTARTIVSVLQEPASRGTLSAPDDELLSSVVQHLAEWATNPAGVPHSRYGTGHRFRQRVLAVTENPTLLSRSGGPYFLFQCQVTRTGNLVDPDKES
ncbi:hypothetical protein [Streptomyces sp. NPDC005435]|uniref:hypothetical protein n=1 Tax=Streptomyces sp. NPDC005435 TaxID=3154464 RepID=UPI003456F2A7